MKTIILRGKPQSTNHLYKPFRSRIYMTSEAKTLKEDYSWQAKTQWKGKPIKVPFKINIDLYFDNNLRRDWDNWHKISMDALTGIVWKDDSLIQSALVTKNIDKDFPRIEITIID